MELNQQILLILQRIADVIPIVKSKGLFLLKYYQELPEKNYF